MTQPPRILIVDDHPIFRDGLSRSLTEREEFVVCGEAGSADEAVQFCQSLSPDLVLLDLSMPGGGHMALARILLAHPEMKVVVLTASEDDDDVFRAMRGGAKGYVLKGVGSDELCEIISRTLAGESYVSPALAARILRELGPVRTDDDAGDRQSRHDLLQGLTGQEDKILHLVAKGLGNKQIARALGLQEKTIKNHMTRILAKLKARSRLEAAMMLRDADLRTTRD